MTETPVKKIVTCKKLVKDEYGEATECGLVLKGECKNRKNHVRSLPTGFCAIGACEGTSKKGTSGRPLKTCGFWQNCPCDCHKTFDMMYSMSKMKRDVVDNSGYEPDHGRFKMPSLEERAMMAVATKAKVTSVESIRIESPMPDLIPVSFKKEFAPTATGRAARGELETWVRSFCDEYLVEKYEHPCTPAFVAEKVGKAQGINPPSSGAVDAVFKRWVKIGFAIVEAKPTRFVGYTPEGIKVGLETLKLKARDAARHKPSPAAALNRRG